MPRALTEAEAVKLAENFRHLQELEAKRRATIAEMIRTCVKAIQREPSPYTDWRNASAERKKIKLERARAFAALEELAKMLTGENAGQVT